MSGREKYALGLAVLVLAAFNLSVGIGLLFGNGVQWAMTPVFFAAGFLYHTTLGERFLS